MVAVYLRAVDEGSSLYQNLKVVPPMAVAALAMAALSRSISLPSGAIHVSQELEFINTVNTGDTTTSHARVIRNRKRGELHLLTIELRVLNNKREPVLVGTSSFILPGQT